MIFIDWIVFIIMCLVSVVCLLVVIVGLVMIVKFGFAEIREWREINKRLKQKKEE